MNGQLGVSNLDQVGELAELCEDGVFISCSLRGELEGDAFVDGFARGHSLREPIALVRDRCRAC